MKRRFEALQSCKGLAAIFIACGHFLAFTGKFTVAYILMCDFFFICSGMTTGMSIKKYESKKSYLEHLVISKVKKIWLPYIIICTIWLIMIYIRRSGEEVNLLYISLVIMLLQCMGFMSNGQEILNTSPIGISWYLSVDFWMGTIYFYIIYLLRKRKDICILLETIIALICWNILVTTSPNYMDVHYAKVMVGNITLTYAMIRALLGYSIGLLVAELYMYIMPKLENAAVKKYDIFFTFLEVFCFMTFWVLYGNVNYYRVNEFAFPVLGAIIVLLVCIERGSICKILKGKVFSFLGHYSFFFYLTHMVARELIVRFIGEEVCYLLLYLAMIVVFSVLLNKSCEYINKIKELFSW